MRAFSELKALKRIEVQRNHLVLSQREALKQGRIQPLLHVIERIKKAVKEGEVTPIEKLETAVQFTAEDSYTDFQAKLTAKYGNFALDLYGTEHDPRSELVLQRMEVVPPAVFDEDTMMEYRYYYVPNYSLPGSIENINPNKFLRLKPKEEFPLLPLIPISPSAMKRFQDDLENKRAARYKFSPDKGRLYTIGLAVGVFSIFVALLTMLFRSEEQATIDIRKRYQRGKEIVF